MGNEGNWRSDWQAFVGTVGRMLRNGRSVASICGEFACAQIEWTGRIHRVELSHSEGMPPFAQMRMPREDIVLEDGRRAKGDFQPFGIEPSAEGTASWRNVGEGMVVRVRGRIAAADDVFESVWVSLAEPNDPDGDEGSVGATIVAAEVVEIIDAQGASDVQAGEDEESALQMAAESAWSASEPTIVLTLDSTRFGDRFVEGVNPFTGKPVRVPQPPRIDDVLQTRIHEVLSNHSRITDAGFVLSASDGGRALIVRDEQSESGCKYRVEVAVLSLEVAQTLLDMAKAGDLSITAASDELVPLVTSEAIAERVRDTFGEARVVSTAEGVFTLLDSVERL